MLVNQQNGSFCAHKDKSNADIVEDAILIECLNGAHGTNSGRTLA